jgi:hypothetical protein
LVQALVEILQLEAVVEALLQWAGLQFKLLIQSEQELLEVLADFQDTVGLLHIAEDNNLLAEDLEVVAVVDLEVLLLALIQQAQPQSLVHSKA